MLILPFNGLIKATPAGGGVTDVFTATGGSDSPGSGNQTIVSRFTASDLTAPSGTPTFTRVTIVGTSANSATIGAAYIGHKASSGDEYDFSATPVQLTHSGGTTTFDLDAATEYVTDDVSFVWDKSTDILIALWFDENGKTRFQSAGFNMASWKNGGGNDASTVDKSSYNVHSTANNTGVSKIQMDG